MPAVKLVTSLALANSEAVDGFGSFVSSLEADEGPFGTASEPRDCGGVKGTRLKLQSKTAECACEASVEISRAMLSS